MIVFVQCDTVLCRALSRKLHFFAQQYNQLSLLWLYVLTDIILKGRKALFLIYYCLLQSNFKDVRSCLFVYLWYLQDFLLSPPSWSRSNCASCLVGLIPAFSPYMMFFVTWMPRLHELHTRNPSSNKLRLSHTKPSSSLPLHKPRVKALHWDACLSPCKQATGRTLCKGLLRVLHSTLSHAILKKPPESCTSGRALHNSTPQDVCMSCGTVANSGLERGVYSPEFSFAGFLPDTAIHLLSWTLTTLNIFLPFAVARL